MQRGLSRSSRRDLAERRDDDGKVPASEEEAHVESRLPLRLVSFGKGLDRGALYRVGSQAWMGNNHHPRAGLDGTLANPSPAAARREEIFPCLARQVGPTGGPPDTGVAEGAIGRPGLIGLRRKPMFEFKSPCFC